MTTRHPSGGEDDAAAVPGLAGLRVVLVNTTHPGNIGAAARAMKNMGLGSLTLVNPQEYPSARARWRAVSAADVLDAARVVASPQEAVEDCRLVIGTSARGRRIPWPLLTPKQCADKVLEALPAGPVALLFGREAHGLTNEELQLCHYHLHIPSSPAYPSLNLAMAVQILVYEIYQASLARPGFASDDLAPDWDQPPATLAELDHFFVHLERLLTEVGFHDPENPRQTLTRLRRLFMRRRLDAMEVSILRGVFSQIQQQLSRRDK